MVAILDLRFLPCPQPLLQVKEALESGEKSLEVLVDNDISLQNILRFSNQKNYRVNWIEEDGIYKIFIESHEFLLNNSSINKAKIVLLTSKVLGRGSDDLGEILMKSFLNTLTSSSSCPKTLVMINTSVYLACDENLKQSFKKIEDLGVKILICGTCLKYFSLENEIKIGQVSNMYEIVELLLNNEVVSL